MSVNPINAPLLPGWLAPSYVPNTTVIGDTYLTVMWGFPPATSPTTYTDFFILYLNGVPFVEIDQSQADSNNFFTFTVNVPSGTASTVSITITAITRSNFLLYYASQPLTIGPPSGLQLNGVAGNAIVTLSWWGPASDGSSPITGYTIQYNQTGTTGPWTTTVSVVASNVTPITDPTLGNGGQITVYNLTNGTTYYFQVNATNADGFTGVYANNISLTPVSTPSGVQNLAATISDSQITLNWVAPSDTGGTSITAYNISYSSSSSSGSVTANASANGNTFSSLTNGITYYFQVNAINAVGPGPTAGISAMPATYPSSPQNFNGTGINGGVNLSWSAPSSFGAISMTYNIQYSTYSTGPWTQSLYNPYSATTASITGLTNGTTYYFQLQAVNNAGLYSGAVTTSMPVGPPTGIPSIYAIPGNNQITLNWGAPSNNGGAAISYNLQYSTTGSSGPWLSVVTLSASTLTYILTGLTNGITYWLQVIPTNVYGTGPATVVSAMPAIPPTIPQNFIGIGISRGVYLSWSAPSSIGALSIISYRLQISTSPSGPWFHTYSYSGTTFSAPIIGLHGTSLYYFQISAENNAGLYSNYTAVISARPQSECQGTTIYKPNNVKFAKQGGVSSSTRTLSLRVNTVNLNGNSFYSAFGAEGANAGKYSTEYNPGYFLKNKYQPPNCSLYYGSKTGNHTVCFHYPVLTPTPTPIPTLPLINWSGTYTITYVDSSNNIVSVLPTSGGSIIYTFDTSGNTTATGSITSRQTINSVYYLCVGGGGPGGPGASNIFGVGGGGGAGGVLTNYGSSANTFTPNVTYNIQVGSGGSVQYTNGVNTYMNTNEGTITALGGGYGGSGSGGSGGGSNANGGGGGAGTLGQGFGGGSSPPGPPFSNANAGGGGGASSSGQGGGSPSVGYGGNGLTSNITGNSIIYGGGGGGCLGGSSDTSTIPTGGTGGGGNGSAIQPGFGQYANATNGTDGLGGGGGGAGLSFEQARGGSGVLIVRFNFP
jgi:hypothetical protein